MTNPTTPTSGLSEAVARVVDPSAFALWGKFHDYCLRSGDSPEEAVATADWAHKAQCDAAIAKAEDIIALIARTEGASLAIPGWRGIESAPVTGQLVIGWEAGDTPRVCWPFGLRGEEGVWGYAAEGGASRTFKPTHWMPLPAAPSLKGGES